MFSLGAMEFSHFLLATAALVGLAHLFGYLAEKLLMPRVIGEVCAGLVLGYTVLGNFYPQAFQWLFLGFEQEESLFALMYQIGLMMLMFCSGLKFNSKLAKGDGKITASVILGSTILPFAIGWFAASFFNIEQFLGTANNLLSLKIVIALSIAVTSIPVISKIFNDLGIMHSRFSKLIIISAGLHDIILWIALGVAISIVGGGVAVTFGSVAQSIFVTIGFVVISLISLYILFKKLTTTKVNFLFQKSCVGYTLFIMFVLAATAGYLKIETIFGALIAGIAVKAGLPEKLVNRIEMSVTNISFSWFIPVYFAIVGLQLNLSKFDFGLFLKFLIFATIAQGLFVYFSCRLIKLDRLTSFNFGMAMNARGGPGIVISTVAYGAGVINEEFFAILVMLALVSSWIAGTWLRFLLKKGWRLMPGDEHLVTKQLDEDLIYNKKLKPLRKPT